MEEANNLNVGLFSSGPEHEIVFSPESTRRRSGLQPWGNFDPEDKRTAKFWKSKHSDFWYRLNALTHKIDLYKEKFGPNSPLRRKWKKTFVPSPPIPKSISKWSRSKHWDASIDMIRLVATNSIKHFSTSPRPSQQRSVVVQQKPFKANDDSFTDSGKKDNLPTIFNSVKPRPMLQFEKI